MTTLMLAMNNNANGSSRDSREPLGLSRQQPVRESSPTSRGVTDPQDRSRWRGGALCARTTRGYRVASWQWEPRDDAFAHRLDYRPDPDPAPEAGGCKASWQARIREHRPCRAHLPHPGNLRISCHVPDPG